MSAEKKRRSVCTRGCGNCRGVSSELLPLPLLPAVVNDEDGLQQAFSQATLAKQFHEWPMPPSVKLFGQPCVSCCERDLRVAFVALLQQRQQIPPVSQDAGKDAECCWVQEHAVIIEQMRAVWKNIIVLRKAVLKSINAANSTLPAPEARLHIDEWNEDGRPPYWRCCDSEKY